MSKDFLCAFLFFLCLHLCANAIAEDKIIRATPPGPTEPVISGAVVEKKQTQNSEIQPEPTVVTSDRLQVDYANNMGTFDGNVLAIDPRITVRADQMIVVFGSDTNETRSIQRIHANGGVVITQDDRKSTSDHAEYTAEDGKVILTGQPFVETPQGTVSGEKITFWRGLQKMDVEAGSQLVIYPDHTQSTIEKTPEQTQ